MKLSAWNRLATCDAEFFTTWSEKFATIGFTCLRPISYRGLSLATSLSTEFFIDPNTEKANKVRDWVEQNIPILEDWRSKAKVVYSDATDNVVTPVGEVAEKKASTLWQDEKFLINITVPLLIERDIYWYCGCRSCARSVKHALGTKFSCLECNTEDAEALSRVTMSVMAIDETGVLKVTAFKSEAKATILGLKANNEIGVLKAYDNRASFENCLEKIRNKSLQLQIGLSNELSTCNVVKWIVHAVHAIEASK